MVYIYKIKDKIITPTKHQVVIKLAFCITFGQDGKGNISHIAHH